MYTVTTKRTICVVTGTRAEYGLLYCLMKEIHAADDLDLQIIATGMHLSSEFGLTYQQIESDGFTINEKVEMLLSSDSEVGIAKSMGLAMIGFADALERLKPDMMVVLGDRFEMFSAASAATIAGIPIAHIHGGEITEGAFDEALRHSITKMSHLHFTSTEVYKNRVIQLGEPPDHVFNVGAVGIDNIKRLKLLGRSEFEESIGFNLGERNLLITFHPVTFEAGAAEEQFGNLLTALDAIGDINLIFTKSNADTNGRIINAMIDDFVSNRRSTAVAFISLGQLRYLSAMQYVDGVVGNSSSGIIEVPSFKKGTINIGNRQKGRIKATSIIDAPPSIEGISDAISKLYSKTFQDNLNDVTNPYGEGGVCSKITKILSKSVPLILPQKEFFDLNTIGCAGYD